MRTVLAAVLLASASTPLCLAAPAKDAGARAPGLAGVWMGMVPRGMGSFELQPRWQVFFDDGHVYQDLPDDGLLDFDRAASRSGPRAEYWGTWTLKGKDGHMQRPGEKFGTTIEVVKPDQIKLDGQYFNRCAKVSGLKLSGSWTSYSDPADPALDDRPAGSRPVIRFTADGRFADEGLFASFLRSGYGPEAEAQDAAGEGSYEIRDFTLVLRYADGRTRREAFSGFLAADPAVKPDILFLRRGRLNRR